MFKDSRGFSITELMIVVAIIAIMAAVAGPNITAGLPTYRVKAAARDATSQLRSARYLALKEKRNVRVSFDAARNFLEIDGRHFPLSGCFTEQYGSGVRFGRGSATKGTQGGAIPADGIDFNNNEFIFTSRGLADFGAGTATGAIYFTNNRDESYAVSVNPAGAVALVTWRGTDWER